jgi:hypothetical protein
MNTFINTTHLDQIYSTFGNVSGIDMIDLVSNKTVQVIKLESWSQFFENAETNELFGSDNPQNIVYDINQLVFDKNTTQQLSFSENNFFFSSSYKLLAKDKADVKECMRVIDPLILNQSELENLLEKQAKVLQLDLKQNKIKEILQVSKNFFELVDILDFLSLAPDINIGLASLKKTELTPIFMLPLRTNSLSSDLKLWLPYIHKDESQLMISMMFTKLEKHKTDFSRKLLKKLIQLDNKSKSQSKIAATLLLKLFIWEVINDHNYAV